MKCQDYCDQLPWSLLLILIICQGVTMGLFSRLTFWMGSANKANNDNRKMLFTAIYIICQRLYILIIGIIDMHIKIVSVHLKEREQGQQLRNNCIRLVELWIWKGQVPNNQQCTPCIKYENNVDMHPYGRTFFIEYF